MSVDLLQGGINYLIEQNPSVVTFSRLVRVPDPESGGTTERTETWGPFRVRIYETSALQEEDVNAVPGVARTTVTWRMLVPADVTVPFSQFVDDEFTIEPYGRFRLRAVVPLVQFGVKIATQVSLLRLGSQ